METPDHVDSLFVFEEGSINTIIKDNHGTIYTNRSEGQQEESADSKVNDNPLVLKLMPIFMDNEEYASDFLRDIEGKKALDITNTVISYRDGKKVSAQLCHHSLWQILHDNKIYLLTERNWNERIKY